MQEYRIVMQYKNQYGIFTNGEIIDSGIIKPTFRTRKISLYYAYNEPCIELQKKSKKAKIAPF